MPQPLLEARGVAHRYGRKVVLDGVDLAVRSGTLVGVVGENGSGKSTLLKVLVRRLAPSKGQVTVRGRVGYCPQEPLVFEALTVRENFAWFAAAFVSRVSGGTRQKLNLCLALLHDPDVLLLDEPYAGFDWETYLHFWEHAQALRAAGKGLVVVSHLLHDRERFDAIHTLKGGRLA